MQKKDIYQIVTGRIIAQLENGVIPWASPISRLGLPKSVATKKAYRGINIFLLWEAPYDSRYWVTYNQAEKLGGHVQKGERGSTVIYWHWRTEEEIAKLALKTPSPAPCYPFMFRVFNLEQCEGLAAPSDDTKTFEHSPLEECERIVASMPHAPAIEFTHGDKASYSLSTDKVYIPVPRRFERPADYYITLFHELGHATGHEIRLNRIASAKHREFGSPEYSFEELVAEMTAAFLCGHCGIENHVIGDAASYINGWLPVLYCDKRILFDAATAAQRAADYILGLQDESREKDGEDVAREQ